MKLGDAIRDTLRTHNAQRAGKIAEFLRFKQGLDYNDSAAFVTDCAAKMDDPPEHPAELWEELLYEADTLSALR